MERSQEIKLCLLGDSGVGKSSIAQRFVNNTFTTALESTIGAAFLTRNVLVENTTYKFNIWDTAGQERYRSLAPMYYRSALAAIVVYDITKYTTFQSLKSWIKELQLHGPLKIILAIAGNKSDLEEKREVQFSVAKKFAEEIGALIIETSARTSSNIEQLFEDIAAKVNVDLKPEAAYHNIQLDTQPSKSKKCC